MVMARGEGGGTLCYFIYIYNWTGGGGGGGHPRWSNKGYFPRFVGRSVAALF